MRLNLTPAVLSFFEKSSGRLTCPELAGQLRRIMGIREAQKKGGQKGGLKTQEKNREDSLEGSSKVTFKVA